MTSDGPVLVTGATGFVGRRLCPALTAAGHDVRAMTRKPDSYRGDGEAVRGDVHDVATLHEALRGCRAAYYLVHSLDSKDFERLDAEAARSFGKAAAEAGVQQIIYLGGLGNDTDQLSSHLRSRREVESLLGSSGTPVTVLRAGIIVGSGGISWEMTRQLVDHLPVMITPRWVRTRTQPIAVADVVRYLVGVLDQPGASGQVFEIGGPEVLQYVTMMRRVAAIKNRRLLILPVPLLSPGLSSRWLALVTDVDTQAGRSLVDSMTNEVVVRTDSIRSLVPLQTMGYDEAVRTALREHEELKVDTSTSQRTNAWLRRARSALELRLPMSIRHVVPIEHREPASAVSRRRRVVAGVSLLGTGLLGLSLSTKPNSKEFYGLTAAVAATWISGGLLSGPLHLGWIQSRDQQLRRPIVTPVATGVGAFAFFYGCALVARSIPALDQAIGKVLTFAEEGSSPMIVATTLANGLGEEVFFRGALYAAVDADRAVVVSTAVYTLATASTRNPALMLAAAVMGTLFSLQRRASGGLQAPVLTHLTWSTLMVRYLPPLFRRAHGDVS